MTNSNGHVDPADGGARGVPLGGDELGSLGGCANDGSHASRLAMRGSLSVSLSRDQRAALLELVEGVGSITTDAVGGVVGGASADEVAGLVELLVQLRGDRAEVLGLAEFEGAGIVRGVQAGASGGLVASAIDRALGIAGGVDASDRGLELAAIYGDEDDVGVSRPVPSAVASVAAVLVAEEADESAVLRALHEDERRRSAAGEPVAIPVRSKRDMRSVGDVGGGRDGSGDDRFKISAWLSGSRGGRVVARAAMIALAAGLTLGGVALVGRALGPGLFDFGPSGVARHDGTDQSGAYGALAKGDDTLDGLFDNQHSIAIAGNGDGHIHDDGDLLDGAAVASSALSRSTSADDANIDGGGVVVAGGLGDRLAGVLVFGAGVGSMEEASALAAGGRLGVRVVTSDLVSSAARTETLASVRSVGGRTETRWRSLDSVAASAVCRAAGMSDGGSRLAGVSTPTPDAWARATSVARASMRGAHELFDGAMASDGSGGAVTSGVSSNSATMPPTFGGSGGSGGAGGWSGVYAVRVSPEPEGLVRLVELVAPGATSVELVRLDGAMTVSKMIDSSSLFGGTDAREALWWEGPVRSWTWPTVVPVVIDPVVK